MVRDRKRLWLRTITIVKVIAPRQKSIQGEGYYKASGRNGFKKKTEDGNKGEAHDKNIDRYHKPEEWWKLSQDKSDKILAIRAKKRSVAEITRSDLEESDNEDKKKLSSESPTTQRNVKFNRNG
jgi:hypothetical protein